MSRPRSGDRLTPDQRRLMLAEYALLPRGRGGRVEYGMRALLARKWGVTDNYIADLISKRKERVTPSLRSAAVATLVTEQSEGVAC